MRKGSMSQERIEAAAKALAAKDRANLSSWHQEEAAEALAAADAVMFSDEATERAAQAMGNQYEPWAESSVVWRDVCRADVRAVVAALKGDQ